MQFLGSDDGYPAPKLKDAHLSESKLRELYFQIVRDMRTMYWEVKLTHADLSEYNILYHNGQAYYIDVSQSVESNHPNALNFLRMDCTNITRFFKKNKLPVMTMRELFEFITSPTIDNPLQYLEQMSEKVSERVNEIDFNDEDEAFEQSNCNTKNSERSSRENKSSRHAAIEDEAFKNVFIPQNLHQVADIERDIAKLNTVSSIE